MDIPETIPGIREALMKHATENVERFSANEASMKALWKSVNALERHEIEEEKEKHEDSVLDDYLARGVNVVRNNILKDNLSKEQLKKLLEKEKSQKNRLSVIDAIKKRIKEV